MMGIYAITNKVNGCCYIGSAMNINIRWRIHKSALSRNKHHSIHLQRAWNKYGQESFEFKVLEHIANKNNLISTEQKYIDAIRPAYNINKLAISRLGTLNLKELSDEARRNISSGLMGNTHTLGHTLIEDHKEKIAQALRGRKHTEESRLKMSLATKGRQISEATRERLSKAFQGCTHTDSARKRISEGLTGRPVSEETRQKISRSLKEWYQKKVAEAVDGTPNQ
jgi:group I intron endonuclease